MDLLFQCVTKQIQGKKLSSLVLTKHFLTKSCGLTKQIEAWMDSRADNALEPGSELPAFTKLLVGFASGEDGQFSFLKADIGPEFYWTPEEAFLSAFPEEKIRADELSDISWVTIIIRKP